MAVTAKQFLAPGEALAGQNEAVVGQNNTDVNKYFNAVGSAYCGFLLWYCDKKSGAGVFNGCANPAYVPTFKEFCRQHYPVVKNSEAQEGDLVAYKDQHVFAVKERVSGTTVITFEGNSTVYASIAEAKASAAGSGKFEGIGYKKRVLDGNYTVYRPTFASSSGGSTPTPAPAPTPAPRTPDKAKVKEFQKFLGVAQDADPGPNTEKAALKKMLLGVLTKRPLRQGNTGDEVAVLQGLFYCLGYDPKGLDKSFGSSCAAAVREFEKDEGLTVDAGAAGKEVVTRLLDKVFK